MGRGLGWFAGLGWVELLFLFLFLILNNSNLFEFKSNLNPTLALKQKEPCTSMNASTKLNLRNFLTTIGTKIRLNAILNTINLRNLNKAN